MEANYRCPVSTACATKPVSVARKPEVLLAPTEHVASDGSISEMQIIMLVSLLLLLLMMTMTVVGNYNDITTMTPTYDVKVMTNDGDNDVSCTTTSRPLRHQSKSRHCSRHASPLYRRRNRGTNGATVRKLLDDDGQTL